MNTLCQESSYSERCNCDNVIFRMQENLTKNRYTDVRCYEHTRVKLAQINNDKVKYFYKVCLYANYSCDLTVCYFPLQYSDYIHANYVDGYKQAKAFIASQGWCWFLFGGEG